MITRRQAGLVAAIAVGAVATAVALSSPFAGTGARYLGPTVASIAAFICFSLILRRQLGENILGDLGFLYMAINTAYTVMPALAFTASDFTDSSPLSLLFPEPDALVAHLWRQVVYEIGVGVGYLWLRGRQTSLMASSPIVVPRERRTVLFIALAILVCITSMTLLSAPVENYWDGYVRYDHLAWPVKKFVSLCVRLSQGFYCLLLVFLFRNYRAYRWIIPPVVVVLCVHEITYSFGARIQSLIILLEAMCCYHFMVKRISFRWAAIALSAMVVLFSALEVVRTIDFDLASAKTSVQEEGIKPASEFGSVFFTGYHLYAEREAGTLPPREWPMFFQDAIALVTFSDFSRYSAMDWYTRNYYPEADVAPFTLGPIADSAIWGGMWDLVLRSIVNGIFFAYIMRWFLKHRERWWGMMIYSYCYATCILTLKYSVFSDLTLILKTLLPCILIVHVVQMIRFPSGPARVARAVTPA